MRAPTGMPREQMLLLLAGGRDELTSLITDAAGGFLSGLVCAWPVVWVGVLCGAGQFLGCALCCRYVCRCNVLCLSI
jgi:hypothetical protein